MTPPDDWRALPPSAIAPLLEAEAARWRRDLAWDVTEAWRAIEPARAAGHLPGFVVRGAGGRPAGWTCYLVHRQTLQVAMVVADRAEETRALLDGILASPEAGRASMCTVCVRAAAPGIDAELAVRGFDVETYRYLQLDLAAPLPVEPPCRAWEIDDAVGMARLCARAYASATETRAFAPHGTLDEWLEYIATLVTGPGCGRFLPAASFAIPGRQARRPDGAVVTTDLGLGTAHLAQIAVDPDVRGRGWGRALVQSAVGAAAAGGFRRMTLLVAGANARATALYDHLGFRERAVFIVGVRRVPRRLRRAALEPAAVVAR